MPSIPMLIVVGSLLALVGYLGLKLYINQRILNAFQRAAVVIPSAPASSGLKTGLTLLGLALLAGLAFSSLIK